MDYKSYSYSLLFISVIIISACNRGPKVITLNEEQNVEQTDVNNHVHLNQESPDENDAPSALNNDMHKVKIVEVLPTENYVYLNVDEDDENYWIATQKMNVEIGGSYYYKGSVLQTNFKSKEYNRTFEEVYLVSEIIPANHDKLENLETSTTAVKQISNSTRSTKNISVEGSLPIADIVDNPEKYKDMTVQISGQCTKLNLEIMNRNWIHLKDGSKDEFDMVVTSNELVTEGQVVSMKGIVRLNKDFGAGYSYSIIIEEGVIVK